MSVDPLLNLRIKDFADLKDALAPVDFGSGAVPARIIETRALDGYSARPQGGFSVSLQADAGPRPNQGIYALDHPQLGRLELFMVPRRMHGALTEFEIILN
ncbi:MAG: hypothetical protein AB7E72_04525 [Lysobacterales bacterium]